MKTIKALLGLAVLVVAVYVGWTMIPPYFNSYKLDDIVAEEARTNTYSSKSEDAIRETVYQKAKDLDIPLTRDSISVARNGQSVSIDVSYTVHLDYPIHPVDLHFQSSSKNKAY